MSKELYIILGMMLVTYIPRLVPFLFISKLKLPEKLRKFLLFIPYTALGALIIPGVFTATPEVPYAGLIGVGFAICYSWLKGGIIVPVLGSVFVTFGVLLL